MLRAGDGDGAGDDGERRARPGRRTGSGLGVGVADRHRPARGPARPGRQLQLERRHRARRERPGSSRRSSRLESRCATATNAGNSTRRRRSAPSRRGATSTGRQSDSGSSQQIGPQVGIFVAPEFEWSYESGASASDAKNFGAVLRRDRFFSPTLVLGIGAGVFRQIDKTRVFPLLIVNWQIDDQWRVSNPFQAGPAGGAGSSWCAPRLAMGTRRRRLLSRLSISPAQRRPCARRHRPQRGRPRVRAADTAARAARSHRSLCRGGHRRETARARFHRGDAVVVTNYQTAPLFAASATLAF